MVVVKSATYGDEYSSTDVLSPLQTKLSKGGDVVVNSSLVPIVSKVLGPTTLTDAEKEDAKAQAVQACGGSSDQTCIEHKTQEFARKRLQEKEKEAETPASIVKGNRLTLKYVGSDGRERTAVIPEGQRVDLNPPAAKPFDTDKPGFSWSSVFGTAVTSVLAMTGTFLYVGSVFLTWKYFPRYGMRTLTWIMTAIAVLVPYSGFVLTLGGMIVDGYTTRRARIQELIGAANLSGR